MSKTTEHAGILGRKGRKPRAQDPLGRRARRANEAAVTAGHEAYVRERHLPRLIPVLPSEIADRRIEARRSILRRLARALRAERNRGRAGHWTYDLNRHIGLRQAYVAERQALAALSVRGERQTIPEDRKIGGRQSP